MFRIAPRACLPTNWAESERAFARLWHQDIAELTAAQVWAELRVVNEALAERLYCRRRPTSLAEHPDRITDVAWLHARRRLLRAAFRKMRAARA